MENKMRYTLPTILAFLIVVIICGTTLYSCSEANNRYYKAMNDCVSQGGSWIPLGTGAAGYSAACAFGKTK